jgi:O-antigen/teichoic acid export membrane protein
MTSSSRLVKNVFFNWAGVGVALVLGFIQAPIVVLGLGNTWYGIWVLVNQLTGYTWLFDIGIREAVVRYVSKHHIRKEFNTINEIVSSAIYLYLLISLTTMLLILALVILLPYLFKLGSDVSTTARTALFIVGLNIAINWFFNAYVGILIGLQRFDIFQKIGMCLGGVNFILVVIFIKAGFGIVALSLTGLGVSMVSNVLVYWQCKKLLPEFRLLRFGGKIPQFKKLINYGKYVFLNNIGLKVVQGSSVLMIGIFLPVSAITIFAIPSQLINYMGNLVSTAMGVLNPLISELESQRDMVKIRTTLVRGTKFSLLVGLPVGLVYLIMGKSFISLWMGKEYGEGGAQVLIILTAATLVALAHHVMGNVLLGMSRHKIVAYVHIAEAVVNIIMTVIFIKMWGLVGAALGMAIAHVILNGVVLPVLVCRSLDFPIGQYAKESIIPPILSGLPFAVCCYFIHNIFPASNLIVFFLWVVSIMPIFILSAWYISFTRTERKEYAQMIYRFAPFLKSLSRQRIP